jgi:hypothetical protein
MESLLVCQAVVFKYIVFFYVPVTAFRWLIFGALFRIKSYCNNLDSTVREALLPYVY